MWCKVLNPTGQRDINTNIWLRYSILLIPLVSMYLVYLNKWAGKTPNKFIYEDRKERGINNLYDKTPVPVYSNFMSNTAFSRGEKGLSFLLTADTKLLWIVLFADNQWLCVHIFIHIYVCIYVYLYTHTQSQEKADSNLQPGLSIVASQRVSVSHIFHLLPFFIHV